MNVDLSTKIHVGVEIVCAVGHVVLRISEDGRLLRKWELTPNQASALAHELGSSALSAAGVVP
jgi:hypothetical protein